MPFQRIVRILNVNVDFFGQSLRQSQVLHGSVYQINFLLELGALARKFLLQNGHVTYENCIDDATEEQDPRRNLNF